MTSAKNSLQLPASAKSIASFITDEAIYFSKQNFKRNKNSIRILVGIPIGKADSFSLNSKVGEILKGSLDWIPSPSAKIQIIGWEVCLRCKGKTLPGVVNKVLKKKSLLTTLSNVLPLHLSCP